jgi:hypothetical protein
LRAPRKKRGPLPIQRAPLCVIATKTAAASTKKFSAAPCAAERLLTAAKLQL